MCKSPIRIRNNSKYLNNQHGQPFYMYVNCGHCSECRTQQQLEWNLRTYYQTLECLSTDKDNYIYFDTLTYNNKSLPRLTNYIESNKNWACFDYRHIRKFYESLRQKIGDNTFKYFIVSEYGDIRKRPHYHIMLFVQGKKIDVLELSKKVAETWDKGITDGIPYKSRNYVLKHNYINKINLDCIRYVAKYVSKQQTFMEVVNKRWEQLEKYYKFSKFDKLQIKKIKGQYFRLTTPFHRQSQHFGETALLYADLNDIMNNNRLYYKDDSLKINAYCSLPMYFKRKLFQKQIKYNGKRIWVNTEMGTKFRNFRENIIIEKLWDRLKDLNRTQGKRYNEITLQEVAYYIIKQRGRLNGIDDYRPHHKEAEYYNYNTDKDLIYLGKKCITKEYAGNDKVGYCTTLVQPIDIENNIYFNSHFEAIIRDLMIEQDDKALILLKEHLNEIRKIFFPK